jgi:autotransporter-associated beta strand protein
MITEKMLRRTAMLPLAGSIAALLMCGQAVSQAQSATWNRNPENGIWVDPNNWTPNSVPNGTCDIATFGGSKIRNITVGEPFTEIDLGKMVFKRGASAYNISTGTVAAYFFQGKGIVNNSKLVQHLEAGEGGGIIFSNHSTAGSNVVITASGFPASGIPSKGPASLPHAQVEGGEGGTIIFERNSSGGAATLIAQGSPFRNSGGAIIFYDHSTGSQAAVEVFGNGFLDISMHDRGSVTIGSLAGNGIVFLGGNNLTIGSNNLTTVFSGSIVDGGTSSEGGEGSGSLTKIGGGALFLTGHNTYTGPTYVNGGALFVNGSIASSQIFVNPGGTFGGTGLIGGTIYNSGGNVQPGDDPGMLTIRGNYQQGPGSSMTIEVDANKPGQFDTLYVQGQVVISPSSSLRLTSIYGTPRLKVGDKIPILIADQGIYGRFGKVYNPFDTGTIVEYLIGYQYNEITLNAVQGSFHKFAEAWSLTPNQLAVAGALDIAAGDRRASRLFSYLDYRPLDKLPRDFDRIAPEELTSIFTIQTALDTQQSLNLQRRTDDIRSGSSGFNAANLAINGVKPSYSGSFGISTGVAGPNGYDGKELKETKQVTPEESRWGAFLSGTGEWVNVTGTDNARGYDLTSGGFTFGADYKVTPNFAVGLMGGYTGTTADLTDHGRVWVNGGKIGLYSTAFTGGWYADAAVTGGYNSYDTRRSALKGNAWGDTDGGDLNVLFGTGYDFKKGGFTFGPTASFNYTYTGINSFNERDSLAPLNIRGQGESLRTAFGMKASYDWKAGSMIIRPEIRAAWQHEYGDATYSLDASFANGAGSGFTTAGPRFGRDSLLLGAGFAVQLNQRCETYVYYDGELGRTNYESASVTGGFRISF